MRKIYVLAAAMALLIPAAVLAQGPTGIEPIEPFKVGTCLLYTSDAADE